MTDDQRIDHLERNLDRILEWNTRHDAKAAFVLAMETALLAAIASILPEAGKWNTYVTIVAAIAAIIMLASMACIFMGTYPRLKGPATSMLYFQSIAGTDFHTFNMQVKNRTAEEYLADLSMQCHRNSEILKEKFCWLGRAYYFMFASLPAGVFAIYAAKAWANIEPAIPK